MEFPLTHRHPTEMCLDFSRKLIILCQRKFRYVFSPWVAFSFDSPSKQSTFRMVTWRWLILTLCLWLSLTWCYLCERANKVVALFPASLTHKPGQIFMRFTRIRNRERESLYYQITIWWLPCITLSLSQYALHTLRSICYYSQEGGEERSDSPWKDIACYPPSTPMPFFRKSQKVSGKS